MRLLLISIIITCFTLASSTIKPLNSTIGRNTGDDDGQQDEQENIDPIESTVSNTTSIQFILLGDWGKGGSTGKYGSSFGIYLNGTEEQTSPIAVEALRKRYLDQIDDKDVSNYTQALTEPSQLQPAAGGGGKGGGGGGKTQTYYQVHIAKAMAAFAASTQPPPSFVLALGDNFYNNGVSSATDILWDYLWKDIYINNYPQLNIPWYPVFGNHDYGGGASGVRAQIERYQAHEDDDIWTFPSTNYTRRFDIPGEDGGSVVVVFVDTTTLAPSVNKCCNQNG